MRGIAVSLVALAGCAENATTPANSVHGQVGGGRTITVTEAVWTVAPAEVGPGWSGQTAVVLMSSEPGLCDRVTANTVLPGEETVSISMVDLAQSAMVASAPSAPGDYLVPIESELAPKTAWLGTDSYDSQCTHAGTGGASSGTVTIETIGDTAFTGTFDVTIDIAGELTGTFAATSCPGLVNALGGTLPACTPM